MHFRHISEASRMSFFHLLLPQGMFTQSTQTTSGIILLRLLLNLFVISFVLETEELMLVTRRSTRQP